ncbi:MAG: hypothetical protein HY748_04465 [Elusimicrobia bacterium]|nr:hypothetical protein [Elusimicrobiota bacterium]
MPDHRASGRFLTACAITIAITALSVLVSEGIARVILEKRSPHLKERMILVPFDNSCAALGAKPGLDKIVVLGSSPAMVETVHNRPFPDQLRERLAERFDVLFIRAGGIDSSLNVLEAEMAARCGWRTRYFIVYAGHQDFNAAYREKCGVVFPAVRPSPGWRDFAAAWLLNHSSTIRLLTATALRTQNRHVAPERSGCLFTFSQDDLRGLLARYEGNMRRIIRAARAIGARTILVTQILDPSRTSRESAQFCGMQNEALRRLARRNPDVDVVDFELAAAPRVRKKDGGCGLFETSPEPGRCGDPYHLSLAGHEIVADLLGKRLMKDEAPSRLGPRR